jgi:hypothetical protein
MMPATKCWPQWYAEDGPTGWTLNESRPDGSDGHLADFHDAGEEECKRAAHCHNCFDDLYGLALNYYEELESQYDRSDHNCGNPDGGRLETCERCLLGRALDRAKAILAKADSEQPRPPAMPAVKE